MMNRVPATFFDRTLAIVCTLAATTSLFACGDESVVGPELATDDPIAAYEALSTQLEACETDQAACTAAANGDATALAQCESAANSCKTKAAPAEARAKDSLRRGADRCRDEDDAGVADDDAGPGGGNMHGCVERRFPNLRRCVRELVGCLDEADFARRSPERAQVEACFDQGHACFVEELSAWRDSRRNRADAAPGAAGAGAGEMSGAAAGSGGSSESGDDDEAERGRRGHRDGSPFDRRRPGRGRSH